MACATTPRLGSSQASGRTQLQNPALLTLEALQIPLSHAARRTITAAPSRPRLGIAYSPGRNREHRDSRGIRPVLQRSRAERLGDCFPGGQRAAGRLRQPGRSGCLPGAAAGGAGALIDPHYKTPYALHASAGIQHAFNPKWTVSADWTHEQGVHSYRALPIPGGIHAYLRRSSRRTRRPRWIMFPT